MAALPEKRHFERASYDGPIQVTVGDREFSARLRDLSVGGAYVFSTAKIEFGDVVELRLELPALKRSGKVARIVGTVRWVRPDGFGVQFGPTGALETYAIAEYVARASGGL